MPQANQPSFAALWVHWILAHATCASLSITVFVSLDSLFVEPAHDITALLLTVVGGLLIVGYAQELILRPFIQLVRLWAIAVPAFMLLGVMVGFIPGQLLWRSIGYLLWGPGGSGSMIPVPEFVINIVCCAGCFGACFGFFQTFYLNANWNTAWCWILANALGFAGGVFGYITYVIYVQPRSAEMLGVAALSGAVGGGVYGIITGTALVLILRGYARYPVKMRY